MNNENTVFEFKLISFDSLAERSALSIPFRHGAGPHGLVDRRDRVSHAEQLEFR